MMHPYQFTMRLVSSALNDLGDNHGDYDRNASTAYGLLQQLVREGRVSPAEFPALQSRREADFEVYEKSRIDRED
jgi:hypothetical protein